MSFVISWLTDTLVYLGLWKRSRRVAFLGLDNSGKTTLVHMLRDDSMTPYIAPTHYPTGTEITMGDVRAVVMDLGGRRVGSRAWKDYFQCMDAIVYVIDALDRERFAESKEELERLLADDTIANCPIVILGNKIDRPGVATEEELKTFFNLHEQTTGKEGSAPQKDLQKRPMEVFMCSVVKKQGYGQGFRWLVQYL